MLKISKLIKVLAVISICLSTQSCMLFAIGAGVGAAKWGSSKQSEAEAKNRTAYNEYIMQLHQINFQRQKSGLAPEVVLTYEQYTGKTIKK